jgi:hypothetical protein
MNQEVLEEWLSVIWWAMLKKHQILKTTLSMHQHQTQT